MARRMLPLEVEAAGGIQQEFSADFALAESTLSLALAVIGSTPEGPGTFQVNKPRGLAWCTIHLAFGLFAKICKQQRSIIALCELGLWQDAACIERCMFEAVLALSFLLRPRVKLTENSKALHRLKTKGGMPSAALRASTTALRRQLYLASVARERVKELKFQIANDPANTTAQQELADTTRALKRLQKSIGNGWASRQEMANHYSGVRILDLARSFGLGFYYEVVYRLQSRHTHALDACDFVEVSPSDHSRFLLDLGPNPRGVSTVLYFAAALLAGATDVLDNRIGLGFRQQVQAMMQEVLKHGKN